MANCHDRGGVTACVLYKDQFRKKKGDTKYNYPFRSFKSHLLLLLVPACSTYAQPAVRSLYQPLIRPCDISSKSDLSMEGGGKYTGYEFFFRYFLGTKYQVLDALRKSTSAVLSAYFYGHTRAYLTCPRVLGRGVYRTVSSRPLVAPARGFARNAMQLHDYQDETALSGRRVEFSGFAGRPVLFVNVASE